MQSACLSVDVWAQPRGVVRRVGATFSCDTAYSDNPTASRACAWSQERSMLEILPLRTVKTSVVCMFDSGP